MKKQFQSFKADMDGWVKRFNSQLNAYRYVPGIVKDNVDNIDHNYELLHEMRAEINKLREEVSALRMVQLINLKSELKNIKKH